MDIPTTFNPAPISSSPLPAPPVTVNPIPGILNLFIFESPKLISLLVEFEVGSASCPIIILLSPLKLPTFPAARPIHMFWSPVPFSNAACPIATFSWPLTLVFPALEPRKVLFCPPSLF